MAEERIDQYVRELDQLIAQTITPILKTAQAASKLQSAGLPQWKKVGEADVLIRELTEVKRTLDLALQKGFDLVLGGAKKDIIWSSGTLTEIDKLYVAIREGTAGLARVKNSKDQALERVLGEVGNTAAESASLLLHEKGGAKPKWERLAEAKAIHGAIS
jgi:hypothetical protein